MRMKRKGRVPYIGEGNGGRFSKLPMWDKNKMKRRFWDWEFKKNKWAFPYWVTVVTILPLLTGIRLEFQDGTREKLQ